jgi:hypothetical protein
VQEPLEQDGIQIEFQHIPYEINDQVVNIMFTGIIYHHRKNETDGQNSNEELQFEP